MSSEIWENCKTNNEILETVLQIVKIIELLKILKTVKHIKNNEKYKCRTLAIQMIEKYVQKYHHQNMSAHMHSFL